MAPSKVQFWFEFASTYSHLAAYRIEQLSAAIGVRIEWKPFLLGPIFSRQGWEDSPFNLYPAKGRYMWRDMERLAAKYAIPFRRPTKFPRSGLLAARVACAGAREAWLPDFVRAVFRANFADDRDISRQETIAAILSELGLDAEAMLAAASTQANKDRLRAQTEEAAALGIFGAPSFVVNGELFWGNDRLEDALRFAVSKGRQL